MNITVDACEVEVESGQYGDPDDLMCRGCGHEVVWGNNHKLLRCLKNIREDNEKAIAALQEQIKSLSYTGKE